MLSSYHPKHSHLVILSVSEGSHTLGNKYPSLTLRKTPLNLLDNEKHSHAFEPCLSTHLYPVTLRFSLVRRLPPEQRAVTAPQRIDITFILIDIRSDIGHAILDGEPVCLVIPIFLAHSVVPEYGAIA